MPDDNKLYCDAAITPPALTLLLLPLLAAISLNCLAKIIYVAAPLQPPAHPELQPLHPVHEPEQLPLHPLQEPLQVPLQLLHPVQP